MHQQFGLHPRAWECTRPANIKMKGMTAQPRHACTLARQKEAAQAYALHVRICSTEYKVEKIVDRLGGPRAEHQNSRPTHSLPSRGLRRTLLYGPRTPSRQRSSWGLMQCLSLARAEQLRKYASIFHLTRLGLVASAQQNPLYKTARSPLAQASN